jgi:hypothetical protein
MPALSERQKRLGLHLPVNVSGQDASGAPFAEATRTLNVSGGGICFESRQNLQPGLRVTVHVELPKELRRHFAGRSVYRARAVVCRVERFEGQPVSRVGARFLGEVEA